MIWQNFVYSLKECLSLPLLRHLKMLKSTLLRHCLRRPSRLIPNNRANHLACQLANRLSAPTHPPLFHPPPAPPFIPTISARAFYSPRPKPRTATLKAQWPRTFRFRRPFRKNAASWLTPTKIGPWVALVTMMLTVWPTYSARQESTSKMSPRRR